MSERDILITAVATLWGSIIALVLYVKFLHSQHSKEQKEIIKSVTMEISKSTTVIEHNTKSLEHNTKSHDKIYEFILKSVKK